MGTTKGGNAVFECRKWPCVRNLEEPGHYEPRSWTTWDVAPGDRKLGMWRMLEECENPGLLRDAIFGTRPMQAGGFCGGAAEIDDYGKWRVTVENPANPHPYLAGLVDGEVMEVGTVVGPEADAFYMDPAQFGLAIPILDPVGGFPLAVGGKVTRLAEGWDFYKTDVNATPSPITAPAPNCTPRTVIPTPAPPYPEFQFIDWTASIFTTAPTNICNDSFAPQCADYSKLVVLTESQSIAFRYNGFGNIVTYNFDSASGGGSVLHIASILSPKALRNDDLPTPNDPALSNLVWLFLRDVLGLP